MRMCELCGARYKGSPRECPLDGGQLTELPDPLLGLTLEGRYVVLEKIGAGGMGAVYRARDEASHQDVAIKFLLSEFAADPTYRERFLREARAANRIDHENIIDVKSFGETSDGLVYLVMEFLFGVPLSKEIDRGPLGLVRSLEIAMQCASALARAHELDVVHRDIKPDNVYLVPHRSSANEPERDFAKILDFGLAHVRGELRLTAKGSVFGTPEYISPEQAKGGEVTGRADLYSLGCVLFEMISGQPPFSGSVPELILKHMREPPPRLSSKVPRVPIELDDLLDTLLRKDPDKRHRDGHHLLEELRRVAQALPSGKPSTRPVSRARLQSDYPRESGILLGSDSTGPVLHEGWEQRVALFRELVPRAYPRDAPLWLRPAIDELANRITKVRALESRLSTATERVSERESIGRALRLRIGNAIDELGRDQSRTLRALERVSMELGEARRELDAAEMEFIAALRVMQGAPAEANALVIEAALTLGAAANRCQPMMRALEAKLQEAATLERESDDLEFQIAQLKGRLGTATAELDHELESIRADARRLASERENAVDDLHGRAMALLLHFSEFPALQAAIGAARLPA